MEEEHWIHASLGPSGNCRFVTSVNAGTRTLLAEVPLTISSIHFVLTGSIAVLHGMEVTNGDEVVTVCYKVLNDNIPIFLKAYLPSKEACASPPGGEFPAVIYFHGGGLTVGNKESWFPTWLKSPFFLLL